MYVELGTMSLGTLNCLEKCKELTKRHYHFAGGTKGYTWQCLIAGNRSQEPEKQKPRTVMSFLVILFLFLL